MVKGVYLVEVCVFLAFGGLGLEADGREWGRMGGGPCLCVKRSAATELTCSHLLNSSAEASSLSSWGRWISLALH